ncbi:MAG: formylglycine-generating enzyme family protein, partial [Pseudomonadota bacterium]
ANYSGGELRFADAGSFASLRVNRGGTWFHPPTDLRAARRSMDIPNIEFPTLGFRIVRSP